MLVSMINERTRQVENIEKMIHLQNKLDFTKSSEASKTSFFSLLSALFTGLLICGIEKAL